MVDAFWLAAKLVGFYHDIFGVSAVTGRVGATVNFVAGLKLFYAFAGLFNRA